VQIGNFKLGADGVFIIAELSANHNGSLQNALNTIKAAKEIGANAIKLQTYTADTITLNCKKEDFLINIGGPWDGKYLYSLYEEAHTPWEWHKELFEYAREIGIEIFSTPFDKTAVDFLEQFSPSAYKIASFEITDYELVRYTASKQKPIIISTGIATMQEIQDVVDICRAEGNDNIILLKCTSSYPAPLGDIHLRTMPDMQDRFGVEVGFSDHTLGITAPILAVALGARVIEKHLIVDKSIGGPDALFSLNKEEFLQMIRGVREAEKILGKVDYDISPEKKKKRGASRSLYVVKAIKEGEIFTNENVRSVRPGYSLHPKHLGFVLGRKAEKDYEIGDRLNQKILKVTS
jgi:pseudaminic acid synthase